MRQDEPGRPEDRRSPGQRDVEKRWSDPAAFRNPAMYCGVVIVIALALLGVFAGLGGDDVWVGAAVPGAFLLGGLIALVAGVVAYSRGRQWVAWQGAAWFLLVLMLFALMVPFAA